MSLESSHECTEQEDLKSTKSAVAPHSSAVQKNSQEQALRSVALDQEGMAAFQQYQTSRQITDLNRSIEFWDKALNLIPPDSPKRAALLNRLGNGLNTRYSHMEQLVDLEAAIKVYQQAVQVTSSDSPYRSGYLANLGVGLQTRYSRTGELADLDTAITTFQQAVQTTPNDSPDRFMYLMYVGAGLYTRYGRTGELADLDAAIIACRQAFQATPSDSPHWLMYLHNLCLVLHTRYERSRKLDDLDAVITVHRQGIQTLPPNSRDRPKYLNNLGLGLRDRHDLTGELDDLEDAITAFQQANQTTSFDSPERSIYLNNLGVGLRMRYGHTGELADLEDAIATAQQVVQTTSPDSPDRPKYLKNLSEGLRVRYNRTRELADLDAAITASRQAVQITPSDSPDPGYSLVNLGNALRDRYNHTRELADLDAAIDSLEQAVQATPLNSPAQAVRQLNLGNGLLDRYNSTGKPVDLDTAIKAYQQAIQAIPPNSPDQPTYLNNLGAGLRIRYYSTGELADLDAAINSNQQATQAALPNSPDQTMYLYNLGMGLFDRYNRIGELADLDAAIIEWEKSWSIMHPRSADLPVIYQLGQQNQMVGIAVCLVTAYLERARQRRPYSPSIFQRTLEIAEGSKSRLLTQLGGRSLLPLPMELPQEIATREQQLLTNLTALDTQEMTAHNYLSLTQEEISHLQRLQQRQVILRDLEDLWTRIATAGPEGTEYAALRRGTALTWQEFKRLTKALGPATALLSLFMTADQALLFLLRAGWNAPRIVKVPLYAAGWADLLERFIREVHHYEPGLHRGETWEQLLRPMFTNAQQHLGGVERLILAPVGLGHLLPWGVLAQHADLHNSAGQPLPLVTLPALSILPRLRQRPHVSPGPALVIGNPRGDLFYAEVEASAVAKRFGTKPVLRAAATKSAVLNDLPVATLIHFATHAFFDTNSPLESGIILADGVLTAREVLQHRLQADLLVLSACESGQVGSLGGEELAGLSQAFLQTGVRSLLVSLWRVNDPATAALIQAFYTAWQAGADKALALRQAMTQIQQDPRWIHPYYWGAFVLMGDWE